MMRDWFPFDIYLCVNYRYTLDDMIEIKRTTWGAIILILIFEAQFARHAESDAKSDFTIWLVICQVALIVAAFWIYVQSRKVVSGRVFAKARAWRSLSCLHRLKITRTIARFMQLCLFFTMYEFARIIANKTKWE